MDRFLGNEPIPYKEIVMKLSLTASLPIYTFFLWPDAAQALKERNEYWFNWTWGGHDRVVVAKPEADDWNLNIFRRWQDSGFIPLAVWLDRPTEFWDMLAREDLGPVLLYLLMEDGYDVPDLLCNPDPELTEFWGHLCHEKIDPIPLGGPNEAAFREVYAEAFNDWLRRIPESEQEDFTPVRPFAASEFRETHAGSGLFELQAFPLARIRRTNDGVSRPQGALLKLPPLVGYPGLAGDELGAAWWRSLGGTATDDGEEIRGRIPMRISWSLPMRSYGGALRASGEEAALAPQVEYRTFALANGTIRGLATLERGARGAVLELSLEADAPARVRWLLRDPPAAEQEREIEAVLEERTTPLEPGVILYLWEQRLGVGAGCVGFDLAEDADRVVLTIVYDQPAGAPEP